MLRVNDVESVGDGDDEFAQAFSDIPAQEGECGVRELVDCFEAFVGPCDAVRHAPKPFDRIEAPTIG